MLNKIDRLNPNELAQATEWLQRNTAATAVIPAAAISSTGIDAVRDWGVKHLPKGPTLYPKASLLQMHHMTDAKFPTVSFAAKRRMLDTAALLPLI